VGGNSSACSTAALEGASEELAEGKRETGEPRRRSDQRAGGGAEEGRETEEGDSATADSETDSLGLAGALQHLSVRDCRAKQGKEDTEDEEDEDAEGPLPRAQLTEPEGGERMGTRLLSTACRAREKKNLLVLDINGLLLQRVRGPVPAGVNRRPDASFRGQKLFERRNMKPFLEWCLQHFHVAVWSTANRENVQSLAEFVLGANYLERVAFVWTQTQVTRTHTHTHTHTHIHTYTQTHDTVYRYGSLPPSRAPQTRVLERAAPRLGARRAGATVQQQQHAPDRRYQILKSERPSVFLCKANIY
jgi:hypothetical protein